MLELADNTEERLSCHLDKCKLASMTAFTFEYIASKSEHRNLPGEHKGS